MSSSAAASTPALASTSRPSSKQSPLLATRLVLLAACVRAAYLLLVVGAAHLIRDYDTSASLLSESCADDWPEQAAAAQQYLPGVVWDSVFLHRVSACGYEYEQFFAFYPGLPVLVRLIRSTGLLRGPWGFAVVALALNSGCFLLSVWLLTKLGQHLLQDDRVTATAVLVFMASPASIHHSMLYTEALFTATSWLGLYLLYCCRTSLGASLAFAASCAVRSNGLLNAGFILHEHGRRTVAALHGRQWAAAVTQVMTALLCTVVCVCPYFAYMLFSFREFCTGHWGPAGRFEPRPWCSQTIPNAYSYVQKVYWMVGFLKYYELNQVPNFLIAGPTLVISLWGALAYAAANPHVFFTGGLLPQQLLQAWFSPRSRGNGSSSKQQAAVSCCKLRPVIVGRSQYCCSSGGGPGSQAGCGGSGTAGAVKVPPSAGIGLDSLRPRHRGGTDQLQQTQQQEATGQGPLPPAAAAVSAHRQHSGGCASACTCSANAAFYRPQLAVFVVHWLVLTLVCLAVVHIQVATRFLSSCAPLYFFAALLMLHKGPLLRWLLWWYCFAFMGVGAVMFTNFLPWT